MFRCLLVPGLVGLLPLLGSGCASNPLTPGSRPRAGVLQEAGTSQVTLAIRGMT